VTVCSVQREVMKRRRDFIALKSGRNRVESLLTLYVFGLFCGHLWTLLMAIPELTGR
jgi:hypothetical protein